VLQRPLEPEDAKEAPYGELEEFEVDVEGIDTILKEKFDFVKMDVEGHEVVLLSAIFRENNWALVRSIDNLPISHREGVTKP
jgi:hypothetical protein